MGEIPENIAINEGVPDEGEGMEMGPEVDENGEENKADDIDIDDLWIKPNLFNTFNLPIY